MIQIGCYQDVQANCSPVPTTSHTSPQNLLQILVFCYVDDICNGGNRCTYKGTGGAGCRLQKPAVIAVDSDLYSYLYL